MTRLILPDRLTTPWTISGGLWALGSLPIFLMGVVSLGTALGWVAPTDDNATYAAHPGPIALHILGGTVMMILGPLQVNARVRLGNRGLHRFCGWLFVLAGFVAGLSAIWMALRFPLISGMTSFLTNVAFGLGICVALVLGLAAIRRGDIDRHRAWILRAYALALGPATQRLLFLPAFLNIGVPEDPVLGALLILGWVINLVVVERVIRRGRMRRSHGVVARPLGVG